MAQSSALAKKPFASFDYEPWSLKEMMPFKVASVYRADNPDTGIIGVSDAFSRLFGDLTETENLESRWKNGTLDTHFPDVPKNNRSLMEWTQGGIHDFTMMSLCAAAEMMGRQPSGGPGRLALDEANIVFVAKTGNFKQIRNVPYRHETVADKVVTLVIMLDPHKRGWFVDVQSVDNPFLWPVGTRVHYIHFIGGV